ncbi:hypothetical protein E1B28_002364 [Marasmius oreades]|uniref:Uncharacterized protein n=1 Tax=Marasmius oreades TaxID=181124 RepID=A0A9P7RMP7_9AGAR|nr:uncharacterized protein E1B28_002364 [Marasmius oreades]KAG7086409.1 hypothetical protein E1B28_002364 [Marasmius oreades]
MPPKRKSTGQDATAAKKAKTTKTNTAARLKKSKRVEYKSSWSKDKPEGKWARRAVDCWNLLPPYDTSIDDSRWKVYYEERAALDKVNTRGSNASEPIVSEELGQDTFRLLFNASKSVSQTMYGAVADEDECVAIARTLRGSLYYTDLWGNDEEGGDSDPRTVNAKTRLYSPFGLGTSIDLCWNYHYRARMFNSSEKFADLVAMSRSIHDCDAKEPRNCSAMTKDRNGRPKPEEGAIKVIKMNGSSISGTTAKNLEEFETTLFGAAGWLSPLKMFHIVAHAGTVAHYQEALGSQLLKRAGLDKFKFCKDETDGKALADKEAVKFKELWEELKTKGDKPICVPQRLVLAAHSPEEDDDEQGGECEKPADGEMNPEEPENGSEDGEYDVEEGKEEV